MCNICEGFFHTLSPYYYRAVKSADNGNGGCFPAIRNFNHPTRNGNISRLELLSLTHFNKKKCRINPVSQLCFCRFQHVIIVPKRPPTLDMHKLTVVPYVRAFVHFDYLLRKMEHAFVPIFFLQKDKNDDRKFQSSQKYFWGHLA